MAPLVPLLISPAGSWWWLRIAANATLPGGASPRAAPPGPPAAALPGSQTTRHSPSRRTGSVPSWAHPALRARSVRAKGNPRLKEGPGGQGRFVPSMAEWLCDPQTFSFCSLALPASPPGSHHPSTCFSALSLGLLVTWSWRLSPSVSMPRDSVLPLTPAVTAVASSLAGHKITAVGLWEGEEK